jgi:DNA-binding winged helix-turn-helix (wHTH) protein/Tol biopolymer transport system component
MRQIYEFGDFRADPAEQLLLHQGRPVPLAPKIFETLLILLNSEGRLIDKDEFISQLWPEVFVEDVALAQNISQLRKALSDGKNGTQMIQTVTKRGYRFAAPVTRVTIEEEHDEVKPFQKTNGFGDSSYIPPATTQIAVAHEAPASAFQVSESAGRPKTRKLLLAGIVAAALGMLVAGFLFLRLNGKHGWILRRGAYPVAEQRVTSNPPEVPVRNAVVSPDGKYVAYADPTGTYLRQIPTGETRPWPLPKGFVAWPNSWFPDSTHLLVMRQAGQPGSLDLWKPSLWKLSLLGGEPQELRDDAVGGRVSPDGSRIAYLPGPRLSTELWVMDSDGSNPRKVVSAGRRDPPNSLGSWIYPVVWSPGGQRIAYIERHFATGPDPAEQTFSLETINADGSGSTLVLDDDPRIGMAIWWAADGRILYAYREGPGSERDNYGVNSIQVDERTGQAIGQPQSITNAEGKIEGLSATSNGDRLVMWRTNHQPQAFIAEFDAVSSRWKTPRRLTLDANANMADAWTSDSKAVLFVSNRNGTWKLFKQGVDETTAQLLVEGRSIFLPRLSADGAQVLYLVASKPEDTSFPASLMSKPLEGGPPHLVLQEKGIINYQCARAPSTLCIFSKLVGQDLIFVSFDLEHGAGHELVRIPNGYTNWSLSPNGSKLAVFLNRHQIRFLTLDTGIAHDVSVKDWPLYAGDWSADGKSVFMPSFTPKNLPVILEVNETGKAEVVLQGNANTWFRCMIQSPDGRYGLLLEDLSGENNAWMVNNF